MSISPIRPAISIEVPISSANPSQAPTPPSTPPPISLESLSLKTLKISPLRTSPPRIVSSSGGGTIRDNLQSLIAESVSFLEGSKTDLVLIEKRIPILQELSQRQARMQKMIDEFLAQQELDSHTEKKEPETIRPHFSNTPIVKTGDLTHELRGPLTAIHGEIDYLFQENLTNEESKLAVKSLLGAYEHLDDVMTEVIKETDEINLKLNYRHPFSIDRIFTRIACVTSKTDPRVRVDYIFKGEEADKNIPLKGDFLKVAKILINLTNNAIKFSEKPGSVSVTIQSKPGRDPKSFDLAFIVTNKGPTISQEIIETKLFKRFGKSEKATDTTQKSASGLGLYLSQLFAQLMGGTIKVKSQEGETSFFFNLSLSESTLKPQTLFSPPVSPPVNTTVKHFNCSYPPQIIFADDDSTIRKIFGRYFEKAGGKDKAADLNHDKRTSSIVQPSAFYQFASSGEDAIAKYETADSVDVVVTDMNMGDGADGIEVIEKICQIADRKRVELPAFFICSGDEPNQTINRIEKLMQDGKIPPTIIYTYLKKPCLASTLVDAINQSMQERINPQRNRLLE